jgi:hypothetical protein
MLIKKDAVFEFLRDCFGKALLVVGLFSIAIGLLYVSPMGSLVCALGLFLGVLMIDVGFVIQFELFRTKLRSREGVGNLLVCVAPLLITGGAVALLFAEPDWTESYLIPRFRMGIFANKGEGWFIVVAPLVRIYLGIAIPLAIAGVVVFVIGFLIKLSDAVF